MKKSRKIISIVIGIIACILMFLASYYYFIRDFEDTGNSLQTKINDQIRPSRNFQDALTIYGNNYFKRDSNDDESELLSLLESSADMAGYNLDAIGGSALEKSAGNLTGLGSLPASGAARENLNLALSYNDFFAFFYERFPDSAWIYYTGENQFVNMYPWVSSNEFSYTENLKNFAFYSLANPANDPLRQAIWTPVYLDQAGKGPMVTLSSPVYDQDTFMGVISIDLTTDWFSKMLDCSYEGYLIDDGNYVISTNQKADFVETLPQLSDLMKISDSGVTEIKQADNNVARIVKGHFIYKAVFDEAPWSLIIVEPVYLVIAKSLLATLPVFLICALLFVSYREIENRRKTEIEIRNISLTDPLTGLNNRRFLDAMMEKEMERADRYQLHLSIIISDLDHFKRVNDTCGHPIGDEVLIRTAQTIKRNLRKADLLVRLGGEEFMILLPETDVNGACEAAEKIRVAIEETVHPVAGQCTASFGVAERKMLESMNSLYKRVDEALYLAKEGGRNCVVSYEEKKTLPLAFVRVEWSHAWESGDDVIDNQHRQLLEIANRINYMSLGDVDYDQVEEQVNNLIEHIVDHFDYEEQLQKQVGFPDCKSHAKIHKELVVKALELKRSYQKGRLKSSEFFAFMLDDVINGHIIKDDVKFFPYIRDERSSREALDGNED